MTSKNNDIENKEKQNIQDDEMQKDENTQSENTQDDEIKKEANIQSENDENNSVNNENIENENFTETNSKNKNKFVFNKKTIQSKKKLIGISIIAILIFIIVVSLLNSRPTIDLNKYTTVNVNGYNNFGVLNVEIDWNSIKEDYGDKIKFDKKIYEEYGVLANMMQPINILSESVYIDVEIDDLEREEDNLINGDKIICNFEIDESVYEYIHVKLKSKEIKHTVKGLEEISYFDPFENLELAFEGIAPYGTAKIPTDFDKKGLRYELDKTKNLSNGDEIIVSVTYSDYYIDEYKQLPSVEEKTFFVSGLNGYITSFSDFNQDFIKTLQKESKDSVLAHVANKYKDKSLSDLEYIGYMFLNINENNSNYFANNKLYIIYTGTVTDSTGNSNKLCFPVQFSEIVKNNKKINYEENAGIIKPSYWKHEQFNNPFSAYADLVNTNNSLYIYECGDGFEKYEKWEAITTLSDIDLAYKEKLNLEAKNLIEAALASEYKEDVVVNDIQKIGEYLLIAKKTQAKHLADNNKYYIVYSAKLSNKNNSDMPITAYYPVEFKGIVKLPNSEYMEAESNGIKGSLEIDGYTDWDCKGYSSEEKMFNELVTASRDEYTFEVSDKLQKFEN